MEELKIIPTQITHIDEIIFIDSSYNSSPWSKELFIKELSHFFSYNFSLKKKNKIIGFCNFWFLEETIEINNFAIHPEYRNLGFGSFFLDFIINCSKKLGAKKILLDVNISNKSALKLYLKKNFKIIGYRKHYYSDGNDCLILIKKIIDR